MSNWKKAQSIVGTNKGKNQGNSRPDMDFYPTPRRGTEGLLKVETFKGQIWECACGDGSMSMVLSDGGYDVLSSDIEPRNYGDKIDFLDFAYTRCPNIVTNPPFKLSQEFAEHALSIGCTKLALLNKLAFLEGIERTKFLMQSPLKNVWVFRKRLKLNRNGDENIKGGGMIAFAWFVWEAGYKGRPAIGWI